MNKKVILITGASSGIGKACFDYLKNIGYTVYGTSRKSDGSDPQMIKMDITNQADIIHTVTSIIDKEGRLDVLVNNAGISVVGSSEFTDPDEIKQIFDTNFWGAVNLTNQCLPHMRMQKSGLIVNVSSVMGLFAIPFQAYYTATKHALEGYSESLRMEVKPQGIHVSLIEPGDFHTAIGNNRVVAEKTESSPYQKDLDEALKIITSGEVKGDKPQRIAHLLHKIIKVKNPKVRYSIGKPLDIAAAKLKRILPQKIFERLIMSHYNM